MARTEERRQTVNSLADELSVHGADAQLEGAINLGGARGKQWRSCEEEQEDDCNGVE